MRAARKLTSLFVASIVLGLSACGQDPCKSLNNKIAAALRDDTIDESELADMMALQADQHEKINGCLQLDIEAQPSAEEFCAALSKYIESKSLARGKAVAMPACKAGESPAPAGGVSVKFYLENSGSMHGYVNGNTAFEGAIGGFLVKAKHFYGAEKLSINYVNTEIIPVNKEIDRFVQDLDPANISVGNTSNSNLNAIFKMILNGEKGIRENDLGVFVSDCIYSISGGDTDGLLAQERNLTMDAFLEKFKSIESSNKKHGFSAVVLKLFSDFNGTYYVESSKAADKKVKVSGKRPYYMWIIGRDALVDDLCSKIPLKNLDGFSEMYAFEAPKNGGGLSFCSELLPITHKKGKFNPKRGQLLLDNVEAAPAEAGKRAFGFGLAFSLPYEKLKIDAAYAGDAANYEVKADDSFVLSAGAKPGGLHANERPVCQPITHVLALSTDNLTQAGQEIKISLKKKLPAWVNQTGTSDDSRVLDEMDKTFGFNYLIGGVAEAYKTAYPADAAYFTTTVSLKK